MQNFIDSIVELKEDDLLAITRELLDQGTSPDEILSGAIEAMGIIGGRYETGEYFLPELLMAGEIMNSLNEIILPLLNTTNEEPDGDIVILGTVKGDVHDIGKNIVSFLLEANGYRVIDLGTDVPPQDFVDKIIETGAAIVGLSALLTVSFASMKNTVASIEQAGLRGRVKIMIGGAPVDDKVLEFVAADARGETAVSAVSLVQNWLAKK